MTVHQKNLRTERVQHGLFLTAAALLIALGFAFWGTLGWGALQFFLRHGLNRTILGLQYHPIKGQFGLLPFIAGSLAVTLIAVILAYPLALSVAITATMVLPRRWLPKIRQAVGSLAAIPSVIFGWWGLAMVVPLVRNLGGGSGFSLAAAGMVLAVMIIPTLSLLAIHAAMRVPERWVEGSLALGATPDQTLGRVVLQSIRAPLAEAGIVAVGRALGETMAVQMVIGGQPFFPHSLLAPGATLTSEILNDIGLLPPGAFGHRVLDVMALLLLVAMYGLVLLVERIGGREVG
ncbi:MAG: ABC transporter permease subunit [Firmicutes bacterium]|jgi:phosphate transport system permease protein|nr:ABC transporter permease subunit [Bacillota bacterium]MCL5972060.1 ABC transporter permease subunit [Bacillota bacterium]